MIATVPDPNSVDGPPNWRYSFDVGNAGVSAEITESEDDIMVFKVVLEPSDEGGYTALVPALPGCISEGETVREAMENIREAVELYLEPLEDYPASEDTFVH